MITNCNMCKKECKKPNNANNWDEMKKNPECLDFEQNEETRLKNLQFCLKTYFN